MLYFGFNYYNLAVAYYSFPVFLFTLLIISTSAVERTYPKFYMDFYPLELTVVEGEYAQFFCELTCNYDNNFLITKNGYEDKLPLNDTRDYINYNITLGLCPSLRSRKVVKHSISILTTADDDGIKVRCSGTNQSCEIPSTYYCVRTWYGPFITLRGVLSACVYI